MISLQFSGCGKRKINIRILGRKEQSDFNSEWDETKKHSYYDDLIEKHCGLKKIYKLNQVHGDTFYTTAELDPGNKNSEGDAILSQNTGEVLLIRTADCIPVFFWSEKEKLFGIIHAGWRGLEMNITGKLFCHLQKQGADLSEVKVYLGPSIGKKNYRIQGDVASRFPDASTAVLTKKDQGYLFGLSDYLVESLNRKSFGIQILKSGICTIDDSDFFSHRRGDKGRNLNLIYAED